MYKCIKSFQSKSGKLFPLNYSIKHSTYVKLSEEERQNFIFQSSSVSQYELETS